MVFKAVTGVDKRVFETYNSPHTSSENVLAALDVTNKHHNHYKNRIVLNWGEFGPSEVNKSMFQRAVYCLAGVNSARRISSISLNS